MIIILTRCYKTTNLQAIKQNVKSVLGSHNVEYIHLLVCDLTKGTAKEQFEAFEDEKTKLYFVTSKRPGDTYCSFNIDQALDDLNVEGYVYILDDDNLLKEDFYQVEQYFCDEIQAIVFNIEIKRKVCSYNGVVNGPLKVGHVVGAIDVANYIVHTSVFKAVKYGNEVNSQQSDGRFFEKIIQNNYTIIYINKCFGYYNALQIP